MIKSLQLYFQDGSNRRLPLKQLCFVFTLIFFFGCKKESNNPEPVIITINTDITYQTIAGFGGAKTLLLTSLRLCVYRYHYFTGNAPIYGLYFACRPNSFWTSAGNIVAAFAPGNALFNSKLPSSILLNRGKL